MERINGPPPFRPPIRKRRLSMATVRASEDRCRALRERWQRELEDQYCEIEFETERQRRGDEALVTLVLHVASIVCPALLPEWNHEPERQILGRANLPQNQKEFLDAGNC